MEKSLAYAAGDTLYLASRDGTNRRKLAKLPIGQPETLRWSPDARELRFAVSDKEEGERSSRLWQVVLGDPKFREVLPGWSRAASDWEASGRWTPKGDFFVFAAFHDGVRGLWAIHERRSIFDWDSSKPVRLTSSAEPVGRPILSPDGTKVLARVDSPVRGELVRFEPKARQFVTWPRMPGVSAGHVSFSPDGKEAAYVTYPQMNLWKMKVNGASPQQLTFGNSQAAMPQWSPDGRRIAFMGWQAGAVNAPSRISVIAATGGLPEHPVVWPGWQGVPSWSPDASVLIFGENARFFPISSSACLHQFDLRTGRTSDLPGSHGLWTARMCPSGRYIAAETPDQRKLLLYDAQKARVTTLASFSDSVIGDNPTWSRDGTYIYFDTPRSADPAIYRIRMSNNQMERVVSLKGIQRANQNLGYWIGLTPENSPLLVRQIQGSEIYSWDFVAP